MPEPIKTKSIYIDNEIFSGVQDGRRYATVDRNSIDAIYLKYGAASKHPVAQLIIGFILIGIGCYPILGVIRMLTEGGLTISSYFIGALLSLPIGCAVVFDLIKKQYFFEVMHKCGREIIVLTGSTADEISEITSCAFEKFGYSIIRHSK